MNPDDLALEMDAASEPKPKMVCAGDWIEIHKSGSFEFAKRVRGTGVVVVIPVIDENLILVEQFRPAVGLNVIEWPAGIVGDGDEDESLEDSAGRELEEETGYKSGRLQYVGHLCTSPGITDEIINFFLATDLTKVSDGGGIDNEKITIHKIPMSEFRTWIAKQSKQNKLISASVLSGLFLVDSHTFGV